MKSRTVCWALDAGDTRVSLLRVGKAPIPCLFDIFRKIIHIGVLVKIGVGIIVAALVEVRVVQSRRGEFIIEQAGRVV